MQILQQSDLDIPIALPTELDRVVSQGLVDLTPWHIMNRDLATKRMAGMRDRYRTKYVPFARRQDNDDVACLSPAVPGKIVIVHDFADEGNERVASFASFWDWFRSAVEDMIEFEAT